MPPYPTLKVKADSENKVATNGKNLTTGGNAIADLDGTPLTNLTASCYVTVTGPDPSAPTRLTQTAMSYVSSGVWAYTLQGSVFPTGKGPWTVKVEVFDPTGATGALLRTFYVTAVESD